ncbi:hypothetical protein FBY58_0429 [Zymomonas mobilis]|uniref:Uncharacterized protein n=1 Tax=Zymomonas mobilis TaxID=542 RepID=A0A542VZZ4_ZYMMB|nr:hypothetical protein FBY58_0429 [Zymomonas mobilis]
MTLFIFTKNAGNIFRKMHLLNAFQSVFLSMTVNADTSAARESDDIV